jgi:Family of unknown function (DUF6157)
VNYAKTLIAVAEDCPVKASLIPQERGGKPTVATLQYEMLIKAPYKHTQEDVLFEVWWQRQAEPALPKAAARKEFFSKDQPCLRTSPLAKTYGWGLLFNEKGGVALCPIESAEYKEALKGKKVDVLKAMRSSKAK